MTIDRKCWTCERTCQTAGGPTDGASCPYYLVVRSALEAEVARLTAELASERAQAELGHQQTRAQLYAEERGAQAAEARVRELEGVLESISARGCVGAECGGRPCGEADRMVEEAYAALGHRRPEEPQSRRRTSTATPDDGT